MDRTPSRVYFRRCADQQGSMHARTKAVFSNSLSALLIIPGESLILLPEALSHFSICTHLVFSLTQKDRPSAQNLEEAMDSI